MKDRKRPLFIIGNPRSGTSLFRLMLTNHKDIIIPPECGFIQWWYQKYKNWSHSFLSERKIQKFVSDLKSSKKLETWNLNFEGLCNLIESEQPDTYAKLSLLVIKQYAKQQNKEPLYFGDKNNYYIDHLSFLKELFPEAYFIFLIRDGRDVACSYKNIKTLKTNSPYKPKLPNKIDEIADEWVKNMRNILLFSKKQNADKIHFLRYEDLLLQTETELLKVTKFLQLDYDSDMMSYAEKNKNQKQEPQELMDWKKKTMELPDQGNIGKFRKELTTDELKIFEKIAWDYLTMFSYV